MDLYFGPTSADDGTQNDLLPDVGQALGNIWSELYTILKVGVLGNQGVNSEAEGVKHARMIHCSYDRHVSEATFV